MLTQKYHIDTIASMSINKKNIVDSLMNTLKCETTRELRDLLNKEETSVYRASVIRWRNRGMGKAIGAVVMTLINRIEMLEKELNEIRKVKSA